MTGKVLQFELNASKYRYFAEERAEKNDFSGALDFLFSAMSINPSHEVFMDIADAYADMGNFELSNKYWFKYLDKAPKDKASVAYEELAINYFYMDNYWLSSYYFHKKISTDGFIRQEGLDKEIIDFFSGEELKKTAYRVVYPPERADYTYEIKRAKHAITIGAFEEAKKSLSFIPEEVRSEETSGELAIACFMSDDLDGAEKVCRESLLRHGENVTAFCNLSTVYDMREDFQNSEYYYQKALGARKGDKGEEYKIATCAIEREDHQTVVECLEKILAERPYELTMRFFYGLALLNTGKVEHAAKELREVYRLNPLDKVVLYYVTQAEQMANGQVTGDFLPCKYVKEFPQKIVKQYQKRLRALVKEPQKISADIKKKDVKEILQWALTIGEGQTVRDAAFVLSSSFGAFSKKLTFDALIDPEVKDETKRLLIYVLIVEGFKERFSVTCNGYYVKLKPKKLVCENKTGGAVFFSAYALCMARMAFWETDNLDKIANVTDKVYKKFKDSVTAAEVSNEELAALILSLCEFKTFSSDSAVTNMFEVSKNKLSKLKKLYKGEQND